MWKWNCSTRYRAFAGWLLLAIASSAPHPALAAPLPSEAEKTAFIRGLMDDPIRLDNQALREEFPEVFKAIETELRTRLEHMLASGEASSVKEAYQRGMDQPAAAYREWLTGHVGYLATTSDDAAFQLLLARMTSRNICRKPTSNDAPASR